MTHQTRSRTARDRAHDASDGATRRERRPARRPWRTLGPEPPQKGTAMGLHSYGVMGVDWEERVRHDRLRDERLARIKGLLEESELGALLCFDMANIRYVTATHIGTWAMDKLARFSLLMRDAEPIVWDFGSAARHHDRYCPWLEGRSPAGISTMRGAMSPESGRAEDVAEKVRRELEQRGLLGEPLGVDVIEPPVWFALQRAGIEIADGQQLMQRAR